MAFDIIDQLIHSTVRIEVTLKDGSSACGTGFFMSFLKQETNGRGIPVIITNRHVIKDSQTGSFHLTIAKPDGLPDLGNHHRFTLNDFETLWINHPDQDVDLAAFIVSPILRKFDEQFGAKVFFCPLTTDIIPTNEERQELSSMEEVVMIGYPSGIWDEVNNLPVIRRGITATHPNINWNDKTEFLTDIASFPGSSGSPVILLNRGVYLDRIGKAYAGIRNLFLGIHYAGTIHTAAGTIEIVTIPTNAAPVPFIQIPNNIGVAINSKRLLDFEPILYKLLKPLIDQIGDRH